MSLKNSSEVDNPQCSSSKVDRGRVSWRIETQEIVRSRREITLVDGATQSAAPNPERAELQLESVERRRAHSYPALVASK